MAIRSDITVDWQEQWPRIIEVAAPSDNVTIQDLYDTLRDICSRPENMDKDEIVDASGKELLGESLFVGVTVKLFNARLKFADRSPPTIVCDVSGGNLVAVDENGNPMNPIEPSANVTVVKTASTSAALIDIDKIDTILDDIQLKGY